MSDIATEPIPGATEREVQVDLYKVYRELRGEPIKYLEGLPRQAIVSAIKRDLLDSETINTATLVDIVEKLNLVDEIKDDDELKQAAQKRVLQSFKDAKYDAVDQANALHNIFTFEGDFVKKEDFRTAVVHSFTQYVTEVYGPNGPRNELWNEFLEKMRFDKEEKEAAVVKTIKPILEINFNDSGQMQSTRLVSILDSGLIQDENKLLKDDIQESFIQFALKKTKTNDKSEIQEQSLSELISKFPLSEDTSANSEMVEASKNHFSSLVKMGYDPDIAKDIQRRFKLDPGYAKELVRKSLTDMSFTKIKHSMKWKEVFDISDAEFTQSITECLINEISVDPKAVSVFRYIDYLDASYNPIPIHLFKNGLKSAYIEVFTNNLDLKAWRKMSAYVEKLQIHDELLETAEIQEAYRQAALSSFKEDNFGKIIALIDSPDRFRFDMAVLEDEAVQNELNEVFIKLVKKRNYDTADRLIDKLAFHPRTIEDPEAQRVIEQKLALVLSQLTVRESAQEELVKFLTFYKLPDEAYQSKEFLEHKIATLASLYEDPLSNKELINNIEKKLSVSEKEKFQAAVEASDRLLIKYWEGDSKIVDALNVLGSEFPDLKSHFEWYLSTVSVFGREDTDGQQLEIVKEAKISVKDEQDYEKAFEGIKRWSKDWQGDVISVPFEQGVEIFGFKRMVDFIKREGLSHHDALHAFIDVVELYKSSGLNPNEFYGNILYQVMMDDRDYSEGTAHHHLNSIAQTANRDLDEVVGRVQEYSEIDRLQDLVSTFDSPQAVFASWSNLKRYSELEQLLGKTEIFSELKELKKEGKGALYRFIETLAFHPDSKVDMAAIIQFWRDPDSFLSADATHTPEDIHDRKKPSNYIHMPNLDLTANELRDALVEGKMDAIQVFSPLEITYTIPVENYELGSLQTLLSNALGSRKEGVRGAAKKPEKLFSQMSKLLKPHKVSVLDYIRGAQLPDGVNLSDQIEALIYNRSFGMDRPKTNTVQLVAKINKKSDPAGVVAGDDTVNCMPFGDGKNTVYVFNPNTAQFVIRIIKGDSKERTIAQSVLTKDTDIKKLISDVITQLEEENRHLEDVLPETILENAPAFLSGDNVEVAPNYSNQRYQEIIEAIMRDFFREYMHHYAQNQGLESSKMPIGQGYTDALSHLPEEPNTYAPQAPVSYSDKTGKKVYMLDLESDERLNLIWGKTVKTPGPLKSKATLLPGMKGIEPLTFEDSLRVAYLEGKAYSDNESLMQFLFNMENALIAKDINNSAKKRSNMSVKYVDGTGRVKGYLLAWEGRLSDENIHRDAPGFYDKPCVYILDIASDRENVMAGGRMIKALAKLYKQNYLEKDHLLPIYAQAREKTSYRIIQKQLEKLGSQVGVKFRLQELPTYEAGDDTMHPVLIIPERQ